MNPVVTNESNFIYRGPGKHIADLACHVEGDDTFSIWRLSDEERKQISRGANIRLGVHGMRPIPPVSLQVVPNVGPFQQIPCPCRVCGREGVDPIHGEGADAHAFKLPLRHESVPHQNPAAELLRKSDSLEDAKPAAHLR